MSELYSICVLYLQQCKQSFFITSMKIEFNLKLMYLHNIYNDIIVYLILIIEIRLKIIKELEIVCKIYIKKFVQFDN